ncbi:cyclin-dependent kinase inhibitor 1 isoform X2 [Brachionichthys hirsutus]
MAAAYMRVQCVVGNRRPARRSLFGPVDQEELEQEYQAALQEDLEGASSRWGFDFKSDTPLGSSDFQWEGIPCNKMPLLYRSCMLLDLVQTQSQRWAEAAVTPKGGAGGAGGAGGEKESVPYSREKCGFKMESPEETPRREANTGLKRKQTSITDFYQAKRRVVGMPRKSGE